MSGYQLIACCQQASQGGGGGGVVVDRYRVRGADVRVAAVRQQERQEVKVSPGWQTRPVRVRGGHGDGATAHLWRIFGRSVWFGSQLLEGATQ